MLQIPDPAIAAAARAARRDASADVGPWTVEAVPYAIASPTTAGLFRVTGADWSLFAKIVQSFRHWQQVEVFRPICAGVSSTATAGATRSSCTSRLAHRLMPRGMRLPAIHGVVELGDDRVAVLMEARRHRRQPMGHRPLRSRRLPARSRERADDRRQRRPVARVRRAGGDAVALLPQPPAPRRPADARRRHDLGPSAHGRPPFRGLRSDLVELAARIPAMLEVLAGLPQLRSHGDACPANLLVPAGEPGMLVAIDWSIGATAPVGDDLGQLLVGLGPRRRARRRRPAGRCATRSSGRTPPGWPTKGWWSTRTSSATAWTPGWSCAARSPRCRSIASASRSPTSWPSWCTNGWR